MYTSLYYTETRPCDLIGEMSEDLYSQPSGGLVFYLIFEERQEGAPVLSWKYISSEVRF
jgi:hypothetical protein